MAGIHEKTWVSLAFLALIQAPVARADSPWCDQILPETTKVFVSTPDFNQFWTNIDQSQLGKLWNSSELEPFVRSLADHPAMVWSRAERTTGTSLAELREVASGEACLAVVELAEDRRATVFLVRVDGNETAVRDLIERAKERLRESDVKASYKKVAGTTCHIFDVPKGESRTVFFLKNNIMGICSDLDLATQILSRSADEYDGTLSRLEGYRDVMARCRERSTDAVPDLRWYCDPAQIMQWMNDPDSEWDEEEVDDEQAARVEGFDAIRGVGGLICLDRADSDLRHWTSIYAPPPYKHAMRIMSFPPGDDFRPPAWIPGDVSSFLTFFIDVPNAYEPFGLLYDGLRGFKGAFDERVQDYAPEVDIKRDLVARLGNRVDFVGQYSRPVSQFSEVTVAVLRISNEAEVALTIKRMFENDSGGKNIDVPGHEHGLWKIGEQSAAFPDDSFENLSYGVMVTKGCLLIAEDFRAIERLVTTADRAGSLADADTFDRLTNKLVGSDKEGIMLRSVSFWDRDYLTSYELLRGERTEEVSSQMVRLILGLLEVAGDGDLAQIGFGKLAPFDAIKKYLGTSGMIGRNHQNGWLLEGVIEPPARRAAR